MTTYEIVLPYSKPPLSLNDRGHWRARWVRQQSVKSDVTKILRAARIPAAEYVTAQLTYRPRDSRRRDTDNLVETLKYAADSIVAAGIVPDDTPAYMSKPEPIIEPPGPAYNAAGARLLLTLTTGAKP